ncbi:MAG: patatin-like phospholipase family protein [Bdellovibrionota bacterium]
MDIQKKKKIGLVLSGGGIKAAAYHIGVCLALKEKGFVFAGGPKSWVAHEYPEDRDKVIRLYVGSSAGSFVASVLAAGYDVESLINAFQVGSGNRPKFDAKNIKSMKPISYRHIFALNGKGFFSLSPTVLLRKHLVRGGMEAFVKNGFKMNGLFSTKGLENYLRRYVFLENDFASLGPELYVTATQLNHSRKALFGPFRESSKTSKIKFINYARISEAVACSIALPPVFAPYGVENEEGKEIFYYDGEIRDTLSAHVAVDQGCDLIISSYSTQPYHFTPEMGSLHKYGIPMIINQALYQVIQQKVDRYKDANSGIRQIYKSIDTFCRDKKMPESDREAILTIIKKQLNFRPEADFIYIHPRAQNYEMFFMDHFSLNPTILEKIVGFGFKSGLTTLKQYGL